MLAAMRPQDARYTAIALPPGSPAVDAGLRWWYRFLLGR